MAYGQSHGARLGCEMTVLSDWDTNQHIDYEWFKDFFANDILTFPEKPFVNIPKSLIVLKCFTLGYKILDYV